MKIPVSLSKHRAVTGCLYCSALCLWLLARSLPAQSQSRRPPYPSVILQEPSMTENQPVPHELTDPRATDALNRLLTFIDSVHSAADFAPSHISRITGVEMVHDKKDPNYYDGRGDASQDWWYRYVLTVKADVVHVPKLSFRFNPVVSEDEPDMTAVCGVDLAAFEAQLQQMGYQFEYRYRVNWLAKQYGRNGVAVRLLYVGESAEKVVHDCIRVVDILAPYNRSLP